MTPPDSGSNRTLAGIAAALGIAIGVAPASLLAQDTAHAKGAEVARNLKVGAAQDKAALGATNNKLNAFTYNKSAAGAAGSVAGKTSTLDKSTTPLYQQKAVVGTQGKLQANQLKTVAPQGSQIKTGVPAVQDKSATQMKMVTPAQNQGGFPAVQQKAAIQSKTKELSTPQ